MFYNQTHFRIKNIQSQIKFIDLYWIYKQNKNTEKTCELSVMMVPIIKMQEQLKELMSFIEKIIGENKIRRKSQIKTNLRPARKSETTERQKQLN